MRALLRFLVFNLVRFFYREIAVSGELPAQGPVILVANHPNGLVDPAILRLAANRSVAFLAKSTLFANPVGHYVMTTFDAIPVYRAKEADTAQNDATFTRARAILAGGGWLALFPEGISHDVPSLQPLKTGAARIALSSGASGLRFVPAGILYEDKESFRSRVVVTFGAPVDVALPAGEPTQEEVRALTSTLADALGDLVLQADNQELWRGFLAVARWSSPPDDLAAVEQRARSLAAAWRTWHARDPGRVAVLVERVQRYIRTLRALGVADPLALDAPPPNLARAVLPLVALAPVALLGAAAGWLPYRLVRPVANHLARGHADLVGTLKSLLGACILTCTYVAQALTLAYVSPAWGLLWLGLGPATGYAALWWGEQLDLRREALRTGWLTANRADIARAVAERRATLVADIDALLG